ncbi:hypothetical protein [Salinarimonas sp.]|uniref:hypothetical protein n=1 Tax=Salinarimonas sp. TaxID=2766526 RepID=UPI0032D8B7FB
MDTAFSAPLDEHRTLWLTEISRKTFDEQALDELESDCGLFVVLEDASSGSFDVLAKVASCSAGRALIQMLIRGMPATPIVLV